MVILLMSLFVCNPPSRNESLRRTFDAVCMVESGGDPLAYKKSEQAAGIAQIRPIYLADCNRIVGYAKYKLADRWDPVKSFEMFSLYVRYYFPNGTPEQWARAHNGGGRQGAKKASTRVYWGKVKAEMEKGPAMNRA